MFFPIPENCYVDAHVTFFPIEITIQLFLTKYPFFQISHWVEDDTTFCLMNLIILFCTDQTSHLDSR